MEEELSPPPPLFPLLMMLLSLAQSLGFCEWAILRSAFASSSSSSSSSSKGFVPLPF